jgi:hypothetical protein
MCNNMSDDELMEWQKWAEEWLVDMEKEEEKKK